MKKMSKQTNISKLRRKALIRRSPLFGVLTVIAVVGCIGMYLLVNSSAYNGDEYELYFADPENTDIHSAGTNFSKKLYTNKVPQVSGKLHVDITVDSHRSRVSYIPSFICASAHRCSVGDGYVSVSSEVDGLRQDFHTCVDIGGTKIGKSFVHLLTIPYKSLQTKEYSMRIRAVWASGTCAFPSGSFTLSHTEGWLIGRCLPSGDADCQGGHETEGPAPGKDNTDGENNSDGTKSGGKGDGKQTGGTGGGANSNNQSAAGNNGGGGSLANAPDEKSNSVPTESAQGKNTQPELKPSPFYDGKTYAPGSNSDPGVIGVATATNPVTQKAWLYFVVGLALLAAGISAYRWRSISKNKKKKKK